MGVGDNEGDDDGRAKWRWVYEELIRIERNWTEQVQEQQARISTLLSVSGVLLGFLAGAGFLAKLLEARVLRWPVYLYVGALIGFCFALFMGIRALRPRIPIAFRPSGKHTAEAAEPPPMWLNQRTVLARALTLPEAALLRELCQSAVENQDKAQHPRRLGERRALMFWQYAFLMLSLVLLIGALVGVLASR
jgi:NADH:ubiquinone oxidoreductase subunit 5 (subunit L)/multisubunit Na+/H+ antiporter MnhA subunit